MAQYCVNVIAQSNGDHEVHKEGCIYWPSHKIDLGDHWLCSAAVIVAKRYYTQSNGCKTCSPGCHTT